MHILPSHSFVLYTSQACPPLERIATWLCLSFLLHFYTDSFPFPNDTVNYISLSFSSSVWVASPLSSYTIQCTGLDLPPSHWVVASFSLTPHESCTRFSLCVMVVQQEHQNWLYMVHRILDWVRYRNASFISWTWQLSGDLPVLSWDQWGSWK